MKCAHANIWDANTNSIRICQDKCLQRENLVNSQPKRIAITGAAGNIAYQAMFRIAAGEFLGPQQTVALNLIDIPPAMPSLAGTAMELEDCAFSLLRDVVLADTPEVGFADADYVFMFGARPRGKGMERSDLLLENGKIFGPQGRALNNVANRNVRVLVIGNPANTNALIAAHHAPNLNPNQFTAMTRLDHERARSQLALKTGQAVAEVRRVTIWGNHSPTMHPDIGYCTIAGTPARELVDNSWYEESFIPTIQQRGAAVIEARGASSAASAANAAILHMRDWVCGTEKNDWTSMSVLSDGTHDIAEGLIFSFPCSCEDSNHHIIHDLELDDFGRKQLKANEEELLAERDAVRELLA